MILNAMEKRLLFQVEGDCLAKVLNELHMVARYTKSPEQGDAAESLMAKLRPLTDAEGMDMVRDIQKNYPAFFVYLNYFQPLGIFLFRSFYALICQIIPGQFLPGKIFFLPDVLILFLGRKPAADVPLLFVFLQHLFDLFIQLGTDLFSSDL